MSDNTLKKKQDLVFTRVFAAPVEEVWKAWSDPKYVLQWWGPDGFTCSQAKMDFREGGVSLVSMRAPKHFGGQYSYNSWTYNNIVPMRQIDFISHFTDMDGNILDPATLGMPSDTSREIRHSVVFKKLDNDMTELIITEYDWTIGQMMEMSRMGMEQCLNKMERTLSR